MIYLTDNGAVYCFEHLGASARYTGFDISGAPIVKVTPEVVAEFKRAGAKAPACETCGASA